MTCPKPLLALLLVPAAVALAQNDATPAQTVPLFPDGAPNEENQKIGEESWQPLKPGEQITRLTNVTKPTLELYPAPGEGAKPAVIVYPGGGYSILAYKHEGTMVADALNKAGFHALVLKYRVPRRAGREPYAAPLEDARKALEITHQKAAEWKIDPERIGVLGFSAGGNLAAHAAYGKGTLELPKEQRPDFAVLVYPAYLLTADNKDLSPVFEIKPESPRAFMVHAWDDRSVAHVDGCARLFLALSAQNVPAEFHAYSKGGHGFGMLDRGVPVNQWADRLIDWLKVDVAAKP